MKELNDDYVSFRTEIEHGNGKIIRANVHCSNIIDKLQPLTLKIQDTVLTINPEGYVYPSMTGDSFCKIGIQMSYDDEYRLGTVFFRSFYTILDYEDN